MVVRMLDRVEDRVNVIEQPMAWAFCQMEVGARVEDDDSSVRIRRLPRPRGIHATADPENTRVKRSAISPAGRA